MHLVVGHRATLGDRALHVVALDAGDDEPDLAVVYQQPVTGAGVVGEALVGGGHPVAGAGESSTVMVT